MSKKKYGERTIEVHAGEGSGDTTNGARATPIYLTRSYTFEDT